MHPRDKIAAAMMGGSPSLNPQADPMAQDMGLQQMAQVTTGPTMRGPYDMEEPENPHSAPSPLPQRAGPFYKDYMSNPLSMPGMGVEQGRAANNRPFENDLIGQTERRFEADRQHKMKQLFGFSN